MYLLDGNSSYLSGYSCVTLYGYSCYIVWLLMLHCMLLMLQYMVTCVTLYVSYVTVYGFSCNTFVYNIVRLLVVTHVTLVTRTLHYSITHVTSQDYTCYIA